MGKDTPNQVTEKSKETAPWFAGLALQVFEELGSVWWIPDNAELEELKKLDSFSRLEKYLKKPDTVFKWQGLELTISNSAIKVPEWDKRINLPKKNNRGRDITVLAAWNTGEATNKITFIPQLSTYALLRNSSKEVDEKFDRLTSETTDWVGGYWHTDVTDEMAQSASIYSVSAGKKLIAHHLKTPLSGFVPVSAPKAAASHIKSNCGNCHKSAVKSWLHSRHSSAMDTLTARVRASDPRCVPCHSVDYMVVNSIVRVDEIHHGVQCENCHKQGVKPVDTCAPCHNDLTDPNRHYLAFIASICTGEEDELAGKCER